MEDNFDELFKYYKKKAKIVNKNIRNIERVFGKDTWAVKKLKNRLVSPLYNGWTKKGRVSISKPNDITELIARISAIDKFMKSKTHTVSGIRKIIKGIKETIKEKMKDRDFDITDDEAEALFDMFEDDDVKFFTDRMTPSQFWFEIQDAREHNDSYDEFYERFLQYFDENTIDDDYRDRLMRIYERYIL